jgi:hypothetical protein
MREPKSKPVNAETNIWLFEGTQSSEEQMDRSTPPSLHQGMTLKETRVQNIDIFPMATTAAESAQNHVDVGGELNQQVDDGHPAYTRSNGATKNGRVRADGKATF